MILEEENIYNFQFVGKKFSIFFFCEHCFSVGYREYCAIWMKGNSYVLKSLDSLNLISPKPLGFGFTPHLLYLIGTEGKETIYKSSCGVCEIDIYLRDDFNVESRYVIRQEHVKKTSYKNWNLLLAKGDMLKLF